LGTDRPASRYQPEAVPITGALAAWMRKAGIDPQRSYSEAELDALLDAAQLDTTQRIAVKAELMDRHLLRASAPGPRGLQAGRGREMQASADARPRGILKDQHGRPVTLVSRI
jgi:hypothetical protein